MPNYILSCSIDNATQRVDFLSNLENAVKQLGLKREKNNALNYYGNYSKTKHHFADELYDVVHQLNWKLKDEVKIYFQQASPKKTFPTIKEHTFKPQGSRVLVFNII